MTWTPNATPGIQGGGVTATVDLTYANLGASVQPTSPNSASGDMSTEIYLNDVLQVDSPQYGQPAISNTKSITLSNPGQNPNNIQVFNWS